jgi:hypothetical protein
MRYETLKRIVQMFEVASSDTARPSLRCVEIKALDGAIRLQATDGTMLAQVVVPDADLAARLGRKAYYVERTFLKMLKQLAREFKHAHRVHLIDVDGELFLGDGVKVPLYSGIQYPETSHVFPTYTSDAFTVRLDALKLLALASALNEGTETQVTLRFKGALDAIEVRSTSGDMVNVGLLMPCRK